MRVRVGESTGTIESLSSDVTIEGITSLSSLYPAYATAISS